jgi:intraflagellar transport protein 88
MHIKQSSLFSRPGEIKWHLMVASCHRRSGDYGAALEKYKWIHEHFPDDTDCKSLSTHY